MTGTLYGIGVGPGDPDLITLKAIKILQQVDIVAVPESKKELGSTALDIARPHLKADVDMLTLTFPMTRDVEKRLHSRRENARLIAEQINQGKNVAFLTLGDPMLYSTFQYVMEHVAAEGISCESIPGIYSFNAISNSLNLPLVSGDERLAVICELNSDSWAAVQHFDTVVCMKVSAYHELLYKLLSNNAEWDFAMVTNAGKDSQQVTRDIADLITDVHYFSTVILTKRKK